MCVCALNRKWTDDEREREMCVCTLNRKWTDDEREREMCVCALNRKWTDDEREREMCVCTLNRNWADAEREKERCMRTRWTENVLLNLFLWRSTEFSASLLQSSVSHDPSEIILIFWFIMSVETVVLLHVFWNVKLFIYFFDEYKVKNRSICSKYFFIH